MKTTTDQERVNKQAMKGNNKRSLQSEEVINLKKC